MFLSKPNALEISFENGRRLSQGKDIMFVPLVNKRELIVE